MSPESYKIAQNLEEEKNNKLKLIKQNVESLGDRLGMGIDDTIKETVALCNIMNIPTSASCEGHLNHGYIVPWIEVTALNEPKWRFQKEEEIYKKVADKYKITIDDVVHAENEEAYTEASGLSVEQEETKEYQLWEKENDKLMKETDALLDEFYNGRDVSDEVRIITDRFVGNFRIHNGGKFYIPSSQVDKIQNGLTKEERANIPNILENAQQEMKNFTEFLKTKYMSSY